jgi:serine/threonine protein kinase
VDERTDVFGLGSVLYEILTGLAPYEGEPSYSVVERAKRAKIVPPRERTPARPIRPDLDALCMRALARKREDRFDSAIEFKRALRKAMLHGSWFETRSYPAGATIVKQGDPSNEAFLIERGTCEVTLFDGINEHSVRQLEPGDVFGETGLFAGGERSATVRAKEAVELQCIDEQSLRWAFSENNPLGLLTKALANRFLTRERELMTVKRDETSD